MDESGTSSIPGNASHFILAGLSILIGFWPVSDQEIEQIKTKYGLENKEIHVAWILRKYLEQVNIPNFERLN
jgi:hypothetical protein